MDTAVWILVVIVLLIAVLGVAGFLLQRRRSQGMQERFGPEYERTVSRTGSRREAESELAAREHRRQELDIVPLDPAARARYQEQWRQTQAAFVDDPSGATAEADELVSRVMRDRGYPVDDHFEGQAAVVSVDHPVVAENYRSAHALFRAHQQGLTGTDDLRQAFVHYRSLFAELLDTDGDAHQETPYDQSR